MPKASWNHEGFCQNLAGFGLWKVQKKVHSEKPGTPPGSAHQPRCHLAMAFSASSGDLKGCQVDSSRLAVGSAKAKATSMACSKWNSLGRDLSWKCWGSNTNHFWDGDHTYCSYVCIYIYYRYRYRCRYRYDINIDVDIDLDMHSWSDNTYNW